MLSQYKINNSKFLNPPAEYKNQESYQNFAKHLSEFKTLLISQVENESTVSYYKFGDGDYFFLKKESVGSAKPGNRALSKNYWRINHKEFVRGSKKNNYYLCEILDVNKKYFFEIFDRDFDFPAEYVYGLLSNKWLTKTFKGKIGIIGAKEKLEIIKNLLTNQRYKEYLGIEDFIDYIEIPQKFACDDIKNVRESVRKQLSSSNSKIFLYGIGHVKSGLSYLLPQYKRAVYLDIGSGVDALAGIIDKNRPYFGKWDNYKIKNDFLYKKIDYLNFEHDGSEIILN